MFVPLSSFLTCKTKMTVILVDLQEKNACISSIFLFLTPYFFYLLEWYFMRWVKNKRIGPVNESNLVQGPWTCCRRFNVI